MTKALRKTKMTRSRLKNIYKKKRSYDNWDKYKNRTTSTILLLKVLVILKNSGKRLNLISATKD